MSQPLILENFDIYENVHQFILIGSNSTKSKYKIIKIPRWTSDDVTCKVNDWFLSITEDEYHYSYEDIQMTKNSLMAMSSAKIVKEGVCGIVGFVRFMQGYYMIVITKKMKVANLGQHNIYKVIDTEMIYLPGNTASPWEQKKATDGCYLPVTKHSHEKRYLSLFNQTYLLIDCYFSYTYDLSNTVQFNFFGKSPKKAFDEINRKLPNNRLLNDRFVWNWSMWPPSCQPGVNMCESSQQLNLSGKASQWLIPITHGYVGQSCLMVGSGSVKVQVCLIARRSRHYAGTRFLKRGANVFGDVANEVESEQIVYEEEVGTLFEESRVTSHVQIRGSIPLRWHQEITQHMRKPPIQMKSFDPYCEVAGRHFSNLLHRYGAPIVILNLVKQRERSKFESPLSEKFKTTVNYLKSELVEVDVADSLMEYVEFDMARIQKSRNKTVLERLAPIGRGYLEKTGIFMSPRLADTCRANKNGSKGIQCGVIRTNCIDCLDRTNTAQFVIGQAAIGYQLYELGVIDSPEYNNLQILDNFLQLLYESHGNILALQYGGSALVHNIETYRKKGKLASQSRDFLQTVSRYLTNKFSDFDKQMSINLFQGVFKPWRAYPETIWDYKQSDMYLHERFSDLELNGDDKLLNNAICETNTGQDVFQKFSSTDSHIALNDGQIWISSPLICVTPEPLSLWMKIKDLTLIYSIIMREKNHFIHRTGLDEIDTQEDRFISVNNQENLFDSIYEEFPINTAHYLSMLDLLDDWHKLESDPLPFMGLTYQDLVAIDEVNDSTESSSRTSINTLASSHNRQSLEDQIQSRFKNKEEPNSTSNLLTQSNSSDMVFVTTVKRSGSVLAKGSGVPNQDQRAPSKENDPTQRLSKGLVMCAVRDENSLDVEGISSASSSEDDSVCDVVTQISTTSGYSLNMSQRSLYFQKQNQSNPNYMNQERTINVTNNNVGSNLDGSSNSFSGSTNNAKKSLLNSIITHSIKGVTRGDISVFNNSSRSLFVKNTKEYTADLKFPTNPHYSTSQKLAETKISPNSLRLYKEICNVKLRGCVNSQNSGVYLKYCNTVF